MRAWSCWSSKSRLWAAAPLASAAVAGFAIRPLSNSVDLPAVSHSVSAASSSVMPGARRAPPMTPSVSSVNSFTISTTSAGMSS